MKNNIFFYIILLLLFATIFGIFQNNLESKETITYFPPDPTATYKVANTSLTLLEKDPVGEYSLQWRVSSSLDQKAFLRQDISFLFEKGKLIAKMGEWKQNTNQIIQEDKVSSKESSLFVSISFHHTEIHNEDDKIFSSQRLSSDQLYIIDSSFSPLSSFREPKTKEEKEWKKIIDQTTNKYLHDTWNNIMSIYSLNKEDYYLIPFTELPQFNNTPLYGFSLRETGPILGRLIEGLYKNYFLGIKLNNKTSVDPLGSTLPLILLAKDRSHLLVISTTKQGEPILLRQQIPKS